MPESKSLSRLTRSLVVGTSAGAIALQIGCVPTTTTTETVSSPAASTHRTPSGAPQVAVASEAEGRACVDALRSKSARAAVVLMVNFPSSRCIPLVLNALTPASLGAIPPTAIARVDPAILAQLPRSVTTHMQMSDGPTLPIVNYRESGTPQSTSSRY